MSLRTRFAPSPTGYMHLGNLRTALYTYLFARKDKGQFILRIEDTDQEREVEGAIDIIYKSLRTAGLGWDEGPDIGGEFGPYIQSQRRGIYKEYAERLVESGGAYYCFCTKEDIDNARAECEKSGVSYKYDKRCLHANYSREEIQRRVDSGDQYVIRQNIPAEGVASFDDLLYGHVEAPCSDLDDNVLLKSDGLPTYNFANVVDDHLMGITHVMRGSEYLSSAPKYNLLYEAFGWDVPLYIHVPPVMRDASHKLSKRDGDPSFEDLLNKGYLKEAIINYIVLLGWSPGNDREFFTLPELEEAFDIKGINKAPAIFDIVKLTWFNWEYIRNMDEAAYDEMAHPWLCKALDPEKFDFKRLCRLLQSRTEVFERLPEMVYFLREMPSFGIELYEHKKMKSTVQLSKSVIEAAIPVLETVSEWSEPAIYDRLLTLVASMELKNSQVLWPVRIAISGKASTPGGANEIAYLLGKEETISRLRKSLEAFE